VKKLNTILLVLGLGFLGCLVWKVGPGDLWSQLGALGWGVVPLILSEGVANLFHTIGWRQCIEESGRRVPLPRLFRMAMAGFAINYLTPTACLGGEVTKAALLASGVKGTQAVSSVLMDKVCMAFAHLLLVIGGTCYLVWRVQLPTQLWLIMAVSIALLTVGIVGFLLLQKYGKLGGFVRWFAARRMFKRSLQHAAENVSHVDEALQVFYRERPLDLVRSVFWHLLGLAMAIFQTWLFLYLIGRPAPVQAILVAAFLGLWMDFLTFAVPMNLGALEGSRILALKTVGIDAATGMAFGLAMRVAQVFWAAYGLVSYGLMTLGQPAGWREKRVAANAPAQPPERFGPNGLVLPHPADESPGC
jgi:uncharacterized protein (TIRG00374 family)